MTSLFDIGRTYLTSHRSISVTLYKELFLIGWFEDLVLLLLIRWKNENRTKVAIKKIKSQYYVHRPIGQLQNLQKMSPAF